jgi:hypothetical protein
MEISVKLLVGIIRQIVVGTPLILVDLNSYEVVGYMPGE